MNKEHLYSNFANTLVVGALALGACRPIFKTETPCGVEKIERTKEVIRFHLQGNCGPLDILVKGQGWQARKIIEPFDVRKYTLDVGLIGPILNTETDQIEIWEGDKLIHLWMRPNEARG